MGAIYRFDLLKDRHLFLLYQMQIRIIFVFKLIFDLFVIVLSGDNGQAILMCIVYIHYRRHYTSSLIEYCLILIRWLNSRFRSFYL